MKTDSILKSFDSDGDKDSMVGPTCLGIGTEVGESL